MTPLIVPGTIDSLSSIATYIKQAATAAALDSKTAYKLRLAVDEIATNIITHGYNEAALTGNITLSVEIDPSSLKIMIEDQTAPFDPTQQNLPDAIELSRDLKERSIGGLGIYLALEGVDNYQYERVGGCNRNTLVIHLDNQ